MQMNTQPGESHRSLKLRRDPTTYRLAGGEKAKPSSMPALELAGLPHGGRKAAQPPVTASNTKCATTGSGGETRQTCSEIAERQPRKPWQVTDPTQHRTLSLMHLATGALGKQPGISLMAATVDVTCGWCEKAFTARIADRNRGWAKCCSKACSASLREFGHNKAYWELKNSGNHTRGPKATSRLHKYAQRLIEAHRYDPDEERGFSNAHQFDNTETDCNKPLA